MGLRSEKEIKERRNDYKSSHESSARHPADKGRMMLLDWVLEGEPRYSVAELKKIKDYITGEKMQVPRAWELTDFLKDKKKAQEVLK